MLTYTGNYVLRINSLASAVKIRFFFVTVVDDLLGKENDCFRLAARR